MLHIWELIVWGWDTHDQVIFSRVWWYWHATFRNIQIQTDLRKVIEQRLRKMMSCHFLVYTKAGRTWDFVNHSGGFKQFPKNLSETLVAGGSPDTLHFGFFGFSWSPKSLPMIDMSNNGDVANVLETSVARFVKMDPPASCSFRRVTKHSQPCMSANRLSRFTSGRRVSLSLIPAPQNVDPLNFQTLTIYWYSINLQGLEW